MTGAILLRALLGFCVLTGSQANDFLAKRAKIMQMNEETARVIFEDNTFTRRPILVLFSPASGFALKEEQEVRAAVDEIDRRFFVVFSGDTSHVELKMMNTMSLFQGEELPLLGILSFDFHPDHPGADFHTFRFRGNITKHAVLQFTLDYLADQLRPEGRLSEPLPTGEGEYDGNVRQLVGLNFDEVTQNKEKDTLVYWYGDGCGWCVKFKKEFKQLAARLRHVKSLDFAWIDASRNGVAQPKRFPTVALFPANGKEVPASKEVPFMNSVHLPAAEFMGDILKGEQTIDALIAWLHQEVGIEFNDMPSTMAEEDEELMSVLDLGANDL